MNNLVHARSMGLAARPESAMGGPAPIRCRASAVTLHPGQIRHLPVPATLHVTHGTLWITLDGMPDDIVLEAGDSRALGAGPRVLACSLGGEAAFELQPVSDGAADRAGRPSAVASTMASATSGLQPGATRRTRAPRWLQRLQRAWLLPAVRP